MIPVLLIANPTLFDGRLDVEMKAARLPRPVQVTSALLKGSVEEDQAVLESGATGKGGDPETVAAVTASLSYLRDRVSLRAWTLELKVRERVQPKTDRSHAVSLQGCSQLGDVHRAKRTSSLFPEVRQISRTRGHRWRLVFPVPSFLFLTIHTTRKNKD